MCYTNAMEYDVYLLRCADGSFYTGFTVDPERRLRTHNAGKGAKYTRSRLPVSLVYLERFQTEHEARSREWHLKRLSHGEKQKLAESAEGRQMIGAQHLAAIENLKRYYEGDESVLAVILDGSVVKGNARPDSDIDAIVVVTEEEYARRKERNLLAEVIYGHCPYENGYFDVKYKTKRILCLAAERASEPTRNAYVKAQVVFSRDEEIEPLIEKISAYPEGEIPFKVRCFWSDVVLNRDYFLCCVGEDNAYMRAHLAQEIVYSIYRLILIENRVLFPCNRRLEDAVRGCTRRPANILSLGGAFLKEITKEHCDAFVEAFTAQTALPLTDSVSENCSAYVQYYEDWWMDECPPFPNEW